MKEKGQPFAQESRQALAKGLLLGVAAGAILSLGRNLELRESIKKGKEKIQESFSTAPLTVDLTAGEEKKIAQQKSAK